MHVRKVIAGLFLGLMTIAGAARVAFGQSSEEARLEKARSWLTNELSKPFSLDDVAGAHLVLWTGPSVDENVALRAQYQRLAHRVAGNPEHPDREEFLRLRSLVLGESHPNMVELFVRGERGVRQSNTFSNPTGGFHDSVVTENVAWTLDPAELRVTRPDKGFPGQPGLVNLPGGVWYLCGFFFDGGLHVLSKAGATLLEVTGEGEELHARLTLPTPDVVIRLRFRWDDASETGLVSAGELRDAQTGAPQGAWAIDGWQWNDAMNRWVAHRWIDMNVPGSIPTQWVADVIEEMPTDQIETYMDPPRQSQPDPLRGLPPLLVDYRSDSRGRVQALLPGAELPEGRLPIQPKFAVVRWLTAGGALAIVVLFVVIKRNQGSKTRERIVH